MRCTVVDEMNEMDCGQKEIKMKQCGLTEGSEIKHEE